MLQLGPIIALAFFGQIYISMAANSPGVFAPVVAQALGVSPQALGGFYSLFAVAAMGTTLLASGIIHRHGGARLLQATGILLMLSLLVAASGITWLVILSALVMGAAVGPHVSAVMHLLARATPVHRLGLMVSLTQAGGAIGVGIAGIVIPQLILSLGWQTTMVLLSLFGLVYALAIQPQRKLLDNDRQSRYPIALNLATLLQPLWQAAQDRVRREIMIAAIVLSMLFQTLVGFIVSYLNLELGFSLVIAGIALAASQLAAVFARVFFGWLSDRLRDPFIVLCGVGYGAMATGLAVALITPTWPVWLICVVAAGYGITSSGWVGTALGAMAAHSPKGQVASATSCLQFVMLVGGMVGPLLFATITALSGRYAMAYALFATMALVVGWRMMRLRLRIRRKRI